MNKNILNKSIKYLSKNKELKILIDKHPIPKFSKNDNDFDSLSKLIIYQQLSVKVAKIFYIRFLSLFENQYPEPEQYLKIGTSELKKIGLSKQKINYINNLAHFFMNNQNLSYFKNLSDKNIINQLITIKGIGQWTIDMFMMFNLFRTDILPIGDLGIKKHLKKYIISKNYRQKNL